MEKPILFNTEMIRAILDGRKTVTRRLIKPRYRDGDAGFRINRRISSGEITGVEIIDEEECGTGRYVQPPYYTGDLLYVRASARPNSDDKWRPSIHMPKAAARIWLKVTDVKVERLHDMSIGDAIAEGVPERLSKIAAEYGYYRLWDEMQRIWNQGVQKKDIDKYGWEANPWVWVIEFERVEHENAKI